MLLIAVSLITVECQQTPGILQDPAGGGGDNKGCVTEGVPIRGRVNKGCNNALRFLV